MRQVKSCILIFFLTFGFGALVGSLGSILVSISEPPLEAINPIEVEIARPQKVCELHGSILHKEFAQLAVRPNMKSPLSPEVEFFESQLMRGSKGLAVFIEYENAWKTEFPHGYRWKYEKCEADSGQCVEIYICSQCRAKEILWVSNALKKY